MTYACRETKPDPSNQLPLTYAVAVAAAGVSAGHRTAGSKNTIVEARIIGRRGRILERPRWDPLIISSMSRMADRGEPSLAQERRNRPARRPALAPAIRSPSASGGLREVPGDEQMAGAPPGPRRR